MTEEITTVTLQQKATLDLVEELRTFLYMDIQDTGYRPREEFLQHQQQLVLLQ